MKENFWEITYKQNIGKMLGICYRYVRDKQVAEDLAHDAFLNAIDKSSGFKGEGHFEAWLRKITVNVALQYLREEKKKEYHREWIQYENEIMESNEDASPGDFTEEELLDAVNKLPDHHKMVFNLFVIDKFSHAEIADELGINESTSKSHLARARKKIKSLLLEKKENKRRIWAFMLPVKLWNIDKTYRKTFQNFEIQPVNLMKTGTMNVFVRPEFAASQVISGSFIWPAFISGGVAIGLLIAANSGEQAVNDGNDKNLPVLTETILPKQDVKSETRGLNKLQDSEERNTTGSKNTDTSAATIVDNSIMYDENKLNNTEMKKLNTVGAILLAGASMGFDSSKSLTTKFNNNMKLPDVQFQEKKDDFTVKRKEGEGTFTASRILWSSKNHNVYMKGINMKAKFEKDRFNATGTVSFLGEVYYLLIDGEEVPLDKDIKLSDSQYSVKALSIQQSVQKYGEKGKNGVVEIYSH